MITKGIIEDIITPYKVKVRIPLFDRISASNFSTDVESLHSATICTLPNCYVNMKIGDVVFVGFEDNIYDKAIILGHLCRNADYDALVDACFGKLEVENSAQLPANTTIGDVSKEQISYLSDLRGSVQQQLNILETRISKLENPKTSNL